MKRTAFLLPFSCHWCSSVPRMSNQNINPNKKWMLSCKPSSVNMLTTSHRDVSPESKAEAGDHCLWFSGDEERKSQYIITWFMSLLNSFSCTASITTGRSRPSLSCLFLSFCLLICTGPAHCVDVQRIKIEKWSGLKINPAEVVGFEADLFSRFIVWPQQCLCQKNGGEQTKVKWKKQNWWFFFGQPCQHR